MEYHFSELDPVKFQRLINAILVARFGEDIRITPLHGPDGGRDGETTPGNPFFEFQVNQERQLSSSLVQPPRKGRYLFQVKYHRTTDMRGSDARQVVINDFTEELTRNVLPRKGDERVNYFFLVTNVPCSGDALEKLDVARAKLRLAPSGILLADVWWQESVIAHLDQMPSVWRAFPEMFAGGVVPVLANVVDRPGEGLPRAIRLAINQQYEQDKKVKFRQIELEQNLSKLFVDLNVQMSDLPEETRRQLWSPEVMRLGLRADLELRELPFAQGEPLALDVRTPGGGMSALAFLLGDHRTGSLRKILLEGGPGQGKSTITQMAAQIYRQQITGEKDMDPENRWLPPQKIRMPFRIELRTLAEWLASHAQGSIEQYLSTMVTRDSGGCEIKVNDIHTMFEKSPVLLIFDGLDEIGNDNLRDEVLKKIMESVRRFENDLQTDLLVVVTTRPPAIAGRRNSLPGFQQLTLAPMEPDRIAEYVTRWLSAQVPNEDEKKRIRKSFESRQYEPHVQALARNPMQLSVLLQFIGLKGEAFPDRRAELYRDYFQIVIDRDVEKSPELRENREVTEALHAFLGYNIHALTEVNQADRSLDRRRLISMVESWLVRQGCKPAMAQQFFKLGEERFGLIVASKGEGEDTKYGFEVQPIQEYFAAAFVSNQISASSAHEFFEAMIRRPYWNEVALFLAGLRRPNEKADLIARAKKMDQDKQLGWRQDGRAVVLQLLQEGVFSEPRYVFSEALDLVLDLLDTRALKVQREPANLLPALESLARRNPSEQHQSRVLRLLQEYHTCTDSYVMERIFRVASRLLPADSLATATMSYEGDNQSLMALVRVGWPHMWRCEMNIENDIEQLTKNPSFWQGVSNATWAEAWWHAAYRSGIALDLTVPVAVHGHLVEQFAMAPTYPIEGRRRDRPFLQATSNLAIWRLVRYQEMAFACGNLEI